MNRKDGNKDDICIFLMKVNMKDMDFVDLL